MGRNLNLDAHIILAQTRDADAGPERLVVGHVLAEVADHGIQSLRIDGHVV